MTKNYLLFLTSILFFKVGLAQSLSSAPTLTFVNNSGISTNNIAKDGDGGSINISDIDIQIYNISDVNGTLLNQLSWEDNNFLNSSNYSYSGITRNDMSNSIGSKGMLIKSVDGKEFKLNNFVYYNWGESSPFTNTIIGYKDNIQVASDSFQGFDGGNYIPMTIILDDSFENVDEVRFYISSGGYLGDQSSTNHSINSIKVSAPVLLGTDDFELSAKFSIYPNPATNQIIVDLKELNNANLEISDINGRKLLNQKLEKFSNIIKIDHFDSGIYFFKINTSEGSTVAKVIKK